ncbi:phage tail protein [Paraurantiacibacter namhicola]|uniref:Uncharacterized protein n=1 Tax=Paraurantiacibacter namhicola TaxID=645517 RepID=A0A1C7D571_9SPHN|nr:phage tail protein [Paraurantiacibacter namhicola]ANU06604.1 hypothetical protein A6F65_00277 [Paraurantiacibacter namhicola]
MATLVFTAIGTIIGGPLGGALGSLIGNQIDRAVVGSPSREGPRLKELAVTTSSYGTPIPRVFGRMRMPGTVIWATDLIERKEESGGGKGSPRVTTYAYSANFAVALASERISGVGRIWADGNLLRGAAGDLKAGGQLRIYNGDGDAAPDPLIASDRGAACPAFRGTAYCVFDGLDLADFGNRIPALSFEIFGGEGAPSLVDMVAPLAADAGGAPLPGLEGYTHDGGTLTSVMQSIDTLYPLSCDTGGSALTIQSAALGLDNPIALGEPTMAGEDADTFAPLTGEVSRRQADARQIPQAVRYYDPARDYQIGMQRADGRARPGHAGTLDFPGTLAAETARSLASDAAERAAWARDLVSWRTAELAVGVRPGSVVTLPDRPGKWRVVRWEWRDTGVELSLERIVRAAAPAMPSDPGTSLPKFDFVTPPTLLEAFEVPFDGSGDAGLRVAYAAASAPDAGWRGAGLSLVTPAGLEPIGVTGRTRAVIGSLHTALAPSDALLFEAGASVEVDLAAPDLALVPASPQAVLAGANVAMIGGEAIQFSGAQRIEGSRWRLTGLLRGRGGTEIAAFTGHSPGTPFVLLDAAPSRLDAASLGTQDERQIAAEGIGDFAPVVVPLRNEGLSLRPLHPVHPRKATSSDGGMLLGWTRRTRGSFEWRDHVDVPLVEEREAYRIGLGPVAAPVRIWEAASPSLEIPADLLASLRASFAGSPLWVQQVGRFDLSPPLLLGTID